jgi:SAM-dependent MidA family methyltransferase
MNPLEQRIAAEIRRRGPIPFGEVMSLALDDEEHGFYATGGSAGRRGDFVTSPEVGPLFGAVVARAIDSWWRELGEPDPFVVIEAGAGPGTLAAAVLRAPLACAPMLRYVLVERSAAQRARHRERLALESPAFAFAPNRADDEDTGVAPSLVVGPIVVSMASMPRVQGATVLLANELLDNLPFDVLERGGDAWQEVRVGVDEAGELVEVLVPTTHVLDLDADEGARVPLQHAAAQWVREARAAADRVVVIDYASTTAELATRPDWLRSYRGQSLGGSPLDDLGAQDITADVCVDQLPPPASDLVQADWLRAHDIDDLVADGLAIWEERKAAPDVAAIEARSRAAEAATLTDPTGLGGFRVLEWRAP